MPSRARLSHIKIYLRNYQSQCFCQICDSDYFSLTQDTRVTSDNIQPAIYYSSKIRKKHTAVKSVTDLEFSSRKKYWDFFSFWSFFLHYFSIFLPIVMTKFQACVQFNAQLVVVVIAIQILLLSLELVLYVVRI